MNDHDLESLGLMKVASTFMNDTLNNVLNIQKIEEGLLNSDNNCCLLWIPYSTVSNGHNVYVPTGKLELDIEPFSISDAVFKVKAALRGGLLQKRIQLVSIHYNSLSLLCCV